MVTGDFVPQLQANLTGNGYQPVAASTTATLGATGAKGDTVTSILVIPTTTAPGVIQIKDGSASAITVFAGGTDSLGNLIPFPIPFGNGAISKNGAWQVIVGAGMSLLVSGNFT